MKSLDIRSEPAVRLLAEFLDMDADHGHERVNAEHFAHGKLPIRFSCRTLIVLAGIHETCRASFAAQG